MRYVLLYVLFSQEKVNHLIKWAENHTKVTVTYDLILNDVTMCLTTNHIANARQLHQRILTHLIYLH